MKIKKYKSHQSGHILQHSYENWNRQLNNEKVNKALNHLNYQIAINEPITSNWIKNAKELVKASTNRNVRKDAVVLASNVITKPQNVPESDEKLFFKHCFDFYKEKLVKNGLDLENSHITGFVHMNETTPHMHLQFIPVQKTDKGYKLNAKKILNRSLFQTQHDELIEYIEDKLGYKPGLLIDEENDIDKLLGRYDIDSKDYQRVKNALTADLINEKECLRRDIKEQREQERNLDSEYNELMKQHKRLEDTKSEITEQIGLRDRVTTLKSEITASVKTWIGRFSEQYSKLRKTMKAEISRTSDYSRQGSGVADRARRASAQPTINRTYKTKINYER